MEHSSYANTPPLAVMEMVTGYWQAQAITTAAVLGIADVVGDQSMSADDIAAAVGADPDATYRLLRALASIDIFKHTDEMRSFANTPRSDTLRSDSAFSVRAMVMVMGGPMHWLNWGELERAVRTGKTPMRHLHGVDNPFEYYHNHPEEGTAFRDCMNVITRTEIPMICSAYNFQGIKTLVDVGGSDGSLLAHLLTTNPEMKGILFDTPETIASVPRHALDDPDLAGRWETVGGDFFDAVPKGGDVYILKNVLDDWDDDRCNVILRSVRKAMAPTSRLLIIDFVVRSEPGPDRCKWIDLNMMLVTDNGRERTKEEFATLLAASGLKLSRITPTMLPVSIIETLPI